jgi:phosphatidylserine/phosphatidylglycerophosphate/cardiolipin synthase-like enzyme
MTHDARGAEGALISLLGGVLFAAKDPVVVAQHLSAWISNKAPMPADDRLDPQLAETARRALDGKEAADINSWCLAGAAWVLGYRDAPDRPGWEVVLSQPQRIGLPRGVGRTTAETIVGIVGRAKHHITMSSPFIDRTATDILGPVLLDAARRGVHIVVLTQSRGASSPLEALVRAFDAAARGGLLRVHYATESQPWPHLKLVLADAMECYVGSANLTGNALMGRNLELGVLLRGDLRPINAVLDLMAGPHE